MISKTKVKQNDQCSKQLWLQLYKPTVKKIKPYLIESFKKGRVFETAAREEFPQGFEIKAVRHKDKLRKTQENMDKDVLFEAAFAHEKVFIQTDVLVKNEDGTRDVIEIKSGSYIKDTYVDDLIIQYFTIIPHIKVRDYWIWLKDLDGSVKKINMTSKVQASEARYNLLVKAANYTVTLEREPNVMMGTHCNYPHECPFKVYCSKLPINKDVPKEIKE